MRDGDTVLATARLRLVPATSTMITTEPEHPARLAEMLGAELAVDWPPEYHDRDTLRFWADALAQPDAALSRRPLRSPAFSRSRCAVAKGGQVDRVTDEFSSPPRS